MRCRRAGGCGYGSIAQNAGLAIVGPLLRRNTDLYIKSIYIAHTKVAHTGSKIPPLRDPAVVDQLPLYASSLAVEIKRESTKDCCSSTWLERCSSLDADLGLSFYDPYVSEPSLDLSPYLEDIDLDTTQQSEIFQLVAAPSKVDQIKQQELLLGTFLHEGDYSYLVEENKHHGSAETMFAYDHDDLSDFGLVPTTDMSYDFQSSSSSSSSSSGSSAPTSPRLPFAQQRKMKTKRSSRGKRNSCYKSRAVNKDTFEYRMKRERNNVAVRKSRLKTKEKHGEIFRKVDELTEENEELLTTVERLTNELLRMKNCLQRSGISPNTAEMQSV